MELEFDVKINSGDLYDYMLHHMYNSAQGLIGTTVGAMLLVAFAMRPSIILYLIFGIVIICYIPVSLFLKAKTQALNPVFKEPLHYIMNDEGVSVSQGDTQQLQKWDDLYKAVSTGRSIILYTTKMNACIFPRKDLKENTVPVIEMISTHMHPKKVKIRY